MKKKVLLVLLVVFVMLVSGCSMLDKYKMVGVWTGSIQSSFVTMNITSETQGVISFSTGGTYSLTCQKIDNKNFQASYGWNSSTGWQNRIIAAQFVSKNELIATVYNQYNDQIAACSFTRQ